MNERKKKQLNENEREKRKSGNEYSEKDYKLSERNKRLYKRVAMNWIRKKLKSKDSTTRKTQRNRTKILLLKYGSFQIGKDKIKLRWKVIRKVGRNEGKWKKQEKNEKKQERRYLEKKEVSEKEQERRKTRSKSE